MHVNFNSLSYTQLAVPHGYIIRWWHSALQEWTTCCSSIAAFHDKTPLIWGWGEVLDSLVQNCYVNFLLVKYEPKGHSIVAKECFKHKVFLEMSLALQYLLSCLGEVPCLHKLHKIIPTPSPFSVVTCPHVATPTYPCVVEVVGGVGRVHDPRWAWWEQPGVLRLSIVFLPVDAVWWEVGVNWRQTYNIFVHSLCCLVVVNNLLHFSGRSAINE